MTLVRLFITIIIGVSGGLLVLKLVQISLKSKGIETPPNIHENLPNQNSSQTLILGLEDEVNLAQALKPTSPKLSNFHLRNHEYFPITQRQMKQCWRALRRPVRKGPKIELDIEATVNLIGNNGMFLSPVFVPRRINQIQLLVLSDHNGSMIPFHGLARRVVDTAMRSGRMGSASFYYFHNCPIDFLYTEPDLYEAHSISTVLRNFSYQTVALIFSDAGAARGRLNRRRLNLTEDFLNQIQDRIRHVVWMNPIPRYRWHNTTAEEIAKLLPMFEVNRSDFQKSINVLRGKYYKNHR